MRFTLLAATALTTTVSFMVPGAGFAQTAYDWNGPYVGASLGVVGTTSDITIDPQQPTFSSLPEELDFSSQGGVAGLTVGYNAQFDNFVVGIEADGSLISLDTSDTAGMEEALDSLLTLRGRLGITNGPVLAYGTLGLAGGNASYSALIEDTGKSGLPAEGSGFVTGVVGGAGVEVALNDSVSIKTEGLMYSLSPLNASGDADISDGGKGAYDSEYTPSGLVVRTGVNVHF